MDDTSSKGFFGWIRERWTIWLYNVLTESFVYIKRFLQFVIDIILNRESY